MITEENKHREFFWKPAYLFPNDGYAPILYVSANNKLGTLKNTGETLEKWGWYVRKYNIKWWIYQDEIL